MTDTPRSRVQPINTAAPPPPTEPPLPPPPPPRPLQQGQRYANRATSALARFAQPFFSGSRPPSPPSPHGHSRDDDVSASTRSSRSKSLNRLGTAQTIIHRTGLSIASLDISPQRTRAVIAGREVFKTIRISLDECTEEFNIRTAIINSSSTHHVAGGPSARQKDQLAINDVKWSRGRYDSILATAAVNGRVVIYDLHRTGLELARFNGHNRQVHRLAFNPHFPAYLLSGSQDSTVRMWDLRSAYGERGVATCYSRYNGNSDAIRDIRWSPSDGVMFATATDSGAVQCWDYRKPNAPLLRIAAHDPPCHAVDWHPDGKHLVSGGADKSVKVWDCSAERRQKPSFHFRAPQAVLNVRWRPPCNVSRSSGRDDWQSTQLITSYDKADPRIHLWDLRRPYIPFRELDKDESSATDLLWRSKDLLWTVGGGAFTQSDIRCAPQVVNRRPMCAVAWSPAGDILAVAQKRPRQRVLGVNTTEFLQFRGDEGSSGDRVTSHQSLTDDSLDEPIHSSSSYQRQSKFSTRQSKYPDDSPPSAEDTSAIVPLEKAVLPDKSFGPCQLGVVGRVSGASSDPVLFRYLAQRYAPLIQNTDDNKGQPRYDAVSALLDALDRNAERAEDVSLPKLAQTWKIVKYAVVQELHLRAREEHRLRETENAGLARKALLKEGELLERPRPLEDIRLDKMKNRLFKTMIDPGGHKRILLEAESTSDMTTPLAQPLPDYSPSLGPGSSPRTTSLPEDLVDLQPLPPSVMGSHFSAMNSVGLPSSNIDGQSIAQLQRQESQSSEEFGCIASDSQREVVALQDSTGDQRSAPRAIEGRADWRRHLSRGSSKELGVLDEDYDQKYEDKRAALRDYRFVPKTPLSYEPPVGAGHQPTPVLRHDSSESFPMFSASTDSSNPAKSTGHSFSPYVRPPIARSTSEGWEIEDDRIPEEEAITDAVGSRSTPLGEQDHNDSLRGMSFDDSVSDTHSLHLERPPSPLPLLTELCEDDIPNGTSIDVEATSRPQALVSIEGLEGVSLPLTPELKGSNPWSAQIIFTEAIRHYCNSAPVDIQTAAHLLLKLHVLFYACERILPPEECESIFKTYNELLLRQSMYVEAAELRLLCAPAYPAVYEYAQSDTFINVFCYTCKRPYDNPTRDNHRCHRCQTSQVPCSICMSVDPPPEWITELSTSSATGTTSTSHGNSFASDLSSPSLTATEAIPASELERYHTSPSSYAPPRPFASALWSWCQGCGHGGHLACITTWLSDVSISEGGCAAPGCMHDCGPGPRREEYQYRSTASRRSDSGFVKQDRWVTSESKAVEKTRGMLSVSSVSGTGTPSGGMMSPKKVRLVTPSEQGKRQNGHVGDSGDGVSGRWEPVTDG
ncbi:hypothetical protein Egran_06452 [Elaphomyces granulatus]|uniref:Uncharacterized protein n=1 Tax=Elaphomyces granulatus TaxID=519963 RepID=A0A232LNQ5_9EURO|nr:hypothetical protein Egran_06452 [Elaphomyces granulatus]